jgi:sec-independent protein translocase protein TatC
VSVTSALRILRVAPKHPVGEDGRMALSDHLRELRARILRSVLVIVAGMVVAWGFYDQLFDLLLGPYNDARAQLGESVDTMPTINGTAGAFMLQLKVSAAAGVVATSPYWLYQIWAFIVPGLHPHERRWTRVFAAIAGPLFLLGVVTGYYVLPKGVEVLINFTPDDVQNLVEIGAYFSFVIRMLLIFGLSFEIPLFVVLLNLAGVVSGKALGAYRSWIIMGVFVFAAVATPSADPFSMLALAFPMTFLFLLSEGIARLIDRRRRRAERTAGLDDDRPTPYADL